jgi:hypothetical protein
MIIGLRSRNLILLTGLALAARLSAQTPSISSLSPSVTTAGASTLTVIVTGSSFLPFDPVSLTSGTVLRWNFGAVETNLPVQYVNATTLRATVAASLLTTPGTATITPSNSTNVGASVPFIINAAPVITTASPLPGGTVGAPYSATFAVTGGTPPFGAWTTPTPPPGLSLSAAGVLSGTPTTAGTFSFTVSAPPAQRRRG